MIHVEGGCHCGNIEIEMDLSCSLDTYSPRACDCDFCRKHGISYVSDPKGRLQFRVKDKRDLGMYRQGSGTAEFMLCRKCGVVVGVTYQTAHHVFAAVNCQVLNGELGFGERAVVSPKKLNAEQKIARWKEVWFSQVSVI